MNSIFLRFPNGLAKALTLSYDDAVEEDVRLIDIMKRHGLKGTFNINSSQYIAEDYVYPKPGSGHRMTRSRATALYGQDGIEPACHALTHAHLQTLPRAQVAYEVLSDRENLEAQFGGIVRGMAYPFGTYNDEVIEVLRACGIAYCRTVESTGRFDLPVDWLRLNPTCHHKDAHLPELTEKFVESEVSYREQAKLFYVWGHAYEFENNNNWDVIENFAARVGNRDDVWYATNIEIYDYIESFHRLIFSLDQYRVTNPSSVPIWFVLRKQLYCVNPGQTLDLH